VSALAQDSERSRYYIQQMIDLAATHDETGVTTMQRMLEQEPRPTPRDPAAAREALQRGQAALRAADLNAALIAFQQANGLEVDGIVGPQTWGALNGAAPAAEGEKKAAKAKKGKKNILNGVVHIQSTFNNTMITITDVSGNVISWSTAGARGFKGSRKSTPFAAQLAAARLQGLAQVHPLRGAAGRGGRGQEGHGPRHAVHHRLRERPGLRPGVRAARPAGRGLQDLPDPGCDPHPPQRLPSSEAPQSLTTRLD